MRVFLPRFRGGEPVFKLPETGDPVSGQGMGEKEGGPGTDVGIRVLLENPEEFQATIRPAVDPVH
jgi:hypothetical protein